MGTMGVKNGISPWHWTELPIQPNVKNATFGTFIAETKVKKVSGKSLRDPQMITRAFSRKGRDEEKRHCP